MKKFLKKNKTVYKFFSDLREKLRIIYNTKTRSRFFWNLRNGDDNLSLDYPLNENSIVFDVGSYKGIFTQKVYDCFNCYVYSFEPLETYFNLLSKKFDNKKKVKIYNFGLLDMDEIAKFSNIDGSSSIYSREEGSLELEVTIKSFTNFVIDNSINSIDLLYMNIEGSEYRLLSDIINSGYINNVKHLQVQFHNFVDGSKKKRSEIRKELKKTHDCVFNFPFIWERWDLKNN